MIQSSIVGILKNIETNIEKQLTERITSKDGLTGLVCRTKCVDYLNDETEDALVIGFDIKNLGQINEVYGPSHGDNYLTSFAYCLKNVFREAKLIGRIGDDEFVVVQKGMTMDELEEAISLLRDTASVAVVDEENPLDFHYASSHSVEGSLWKGYKAIMHEIALMK